MELKWSKPTWAIVSWTALMVILIIVALGCGTASTPEAKGVQVSSSGKVLPTPVPTPFPTIGPPADVAATKTALDAIDAYRRQVAQATRTAIEAQQETARHAASLEATRVAELPTPTPEPTPTPLPTPPPHPATFCREWEALVLDWIKQGNSYWDKNYTTRYSEIPDLPGLTAKQGHEHCITDFPTGLMHPTGLPTGLMYGMYQDFIYQEPRSVGDGNREYLPGTYQYRREGRDHRVEGIGCAIILNQEERENRSEVDLTYGEPFTFTFYSYHGQVSLMGSGHVSLMGSEGIKNCKGVLYRIGD